jgi:hypothetical protein
VAFSENQQSRFKAVPAAQARLPEALFEKLNGSLTAYTIIIGRSSGNHRTQEDLVSTLRANLMTWLRTEWSRRYLYDFGLTEFRPGEFEDEFEFEDD